MTGLPCFSPGKTMTGHFNISILLLQKNLSGELELYHFRVINKCLVVLLMTIRKSYTVISSDRNEVVPFFLTWLIPKEIY
jgi:hypothetical protein